jgi:hypothetical protein
MATILTAGEVVQLVGIVSNLLLNGATGTVEGNTDYESQGRYAVHLQSPAAAMAAHPYGITLNPLNLMKVMRCAKSGCNEKGTKSCSACLKEYYCCGECQKADWNTHKLICQLIKLMPDTLLPFKDAGLVLEKVMNLTQAQIDKLDY